MTSQPLCIFCAAPIKKQTRTVYLRTRPLQPHEGINSFSRYLVVDKLPKTIDECRKLTNQQVVSVKRSHADQSSIGYFSEWDGASYVDHFFCNGDHAKQFGYAAAAAGQRMRAWNDAMKLQQEQKS